jgi:hypothetical protein
MDDNYHQELARAWSTMDQFVVHGTPAPLSTMSQPCRLNLLGAQTRHMVVEAPDTCLGWPGLDRPMTQPSRSDKGPNQPNKDWSMLTIDWTYLSVTVGLHPIRDCHVSFFGVFSPFSF